MLVSCTDTCPTGGRRRRVFACPSVDCGNFWTIVSRRIDAMRCAALRYNVMLLIRSTWRRQVVGCRHLQVTEVAVAGRAAEGLRTTTARPGTIAKNNKDGDGCR